MKNERGIILLVVVWALMVLMVISFELARTMRIEGLTTDVYQQEATTYYLALAGLNRAAYEFVRAGQQGRTLRDQSHIGGGLETSEQEEEEKIGDIWARGDGQWQKEPFGAGGYWVRVIDEGGKINLNQADEITLRQTFTNLGFEPDFGDALTDAILDWRDPDSLERLHGAESDYYLSLPVPYPAKDGPFDTIDELLLIRGVTPELFYNQLRDIFTVYGSDSEDGTMTNLLTASPLVLQAVLGVDAETAESLIQQRNETGAMDLANFMPEGTGAQALNSLPRIVTIESVGYLNTGKMTRALSAVVTRAGTNGFRMFYWKDRVLGVQVPDQSEEE